MRAMLILFGVLVPALGSTADAQGRAVPRGGPDDTVTVTGCLRRGPSGWVLANVEAVRSGDAGASKEPSSVARSYALKAGRRVALESHVGSKVQLVGTVTPAPKDAGAAEDGREPLPLLTVTALEVVSPICLQ